MAKCVPYLVKDPISAVYRFIGCFSSDSYAIDHCRSLFPDVIVDLYRLSSHIVVYSVHHEKEKF